MKPCLLYLCLFAGVIIPASAQDQPQSQTATTPKKKSLFGKIMEGAGQVITVNGQPIGNSFGGNSTGVTRLNDKIIQNEWSEFGGGGTWQGAGHLDFVTTSPRNHIYYFEVAEPNTKVTFSAESNMPNLPRAIVTEYDGGVNSYFDDYTLPRAGTYKIQVATQWRYQKGRYRMELKGPILNLRQEMAPRWVDQGLTFGEEGGGGGTNNFFSPRNHHYIFEPEEGTVLDINVESNGVPIQVGLINPAGAVNGGMYGGEPGLHYVVSKADQKGLYQIWVTTAEPNAKATYKLEVMGKLKTSPKRRDYKFQAQKGQFTANSKRHEYTIPAQPSILEIIYRSANAEASSIKVYDKNGTEIEPHFDNSPTARLINRSYVIKEAGSCKLIVETQQPTSGDYDLLTWGIFDPITQKEVQTGTIQPRKQQIPGYQPQKKPEPVVVDNSTAETVIVSGRVRGSRPDMSLTTMQVVYEDLDTGEKVGGVNPDEQGMYSFSVTSGRRYGITVVSEDNYIASSQNVDLIKRTPGRSKVSVNEISVISGEAGDVINLNNIFFQTGKATLLPASYTELNRIGKFLKDHPTLHIEIAGHTDNQGSVPVNKVLSTDRALAVAYNLQGQQIKQDRVSAVGYGPAKPVAPNTTENGRAMNRRVEFRIVGQ